MSTGNAQISEAGQPIVRCGDVTPMTTGRREFDCLPSNPPLLIGVEDFLDRFRLLVDYRAKYLRLSW